MGLVCNRASPCRRNSSVAAKPLIDVGTQTGNAEMAANDAAMLRAKMALASANMQELDVLLNWRSRHYGARTCGDIHLW